MNSSLATLFYRNRHLLFLSIVVIMVAGLGAALNLPRQEDPRIVNRSPIILTFMPGASSDRIETLITEKLENGLNEIDEIKNIESTSRAGVSLVSVELLDAVQEDRKDEIFSRIRDKVQEVQPLLPPEATVPFIDDKRDPIAFTKIIAVQWTAAGEIPLGLLNRLAEDLADRIRNVPGTEIVRLYGAPDEEITVAADWEELAELGLSVESLASQIAAADTKSPAGVLRSENANVQLEVDGELDSLQRIAEVPVLTNPSFGVLRVGDIAEVKRGWQLPVREMAYIDHQRSILLAVRMRGEQRVDLWAEQVRDVMATFEDSLGENIAISPFFEQVDYTMARLNELIGNLIAGAAIVVLTVFLMMGWRLALIIGAALPLVVSLVLFVFQLGSIPIHQMSIFGMIIALGLLIDNAIVMADEVATRIGRGQSRLQAVEGAVGHLFFPLLSSTITTVLAFAPIMLLPGGAGDFVGTISVGVILALIASFFVAMTIVSGLSGRFVQHGNSKANVLSRGLGHYVEKLLAPVIRLALLRPILAAALVVLLSFGGFALSSTLGNSFFPAVDRNMFEVHVWLPESASIERTSRDALEMDRLAREFPETRHVYWLAGGSFPSVYYNLIMNQDNSPHYAHGIIVTGSSDETETLIPKLQQQLTHEFPHAQIVVREFGQGPPVVADVEYRLFGPDMDVLKDLGEQVRLKLQQQPEVQVTQTSLPRARPKLFIDADQNEVHLAGLSLGMLARQFQSNLEGSMGGTLIEDLEELPVRVRLTSDRRSAEKAITATLLASRTGSDSIPLAALGEVELRPETGGITRYNGERTNIISAYTLEGALPIEISRRVLQEIETEKLIPPGYRIDVGGAAEQDGEAKGNLLLYVPVLLTLTVATLILTFRSVILAALLVVAAGLSVGFGLATTWVAQFPISFNTILGSLGLIGLAFNNSIVVIAAIRSETVARSGEMDAVYHAVMGTSQHIVSTTLTTIGGFMPLLLLAGGEFWPSLAIVLGGGVGGSMLIALILVPAAYLLLCRIHLLGTRPAAAPAPATQPRETVAL
ncbi:MAG: efflux RND transporter permease subunit [Verrucomicrobiota bacterium]